MKILEYGRHCFGPILRVDGKDYEDMSNEERLNIIVELVKKCEYTMQEVFKFALEYADGETLEEDFHKCDQCGDYNEYIKKEI